MFLNKNCTFNMLSIPKDLFVLFYVGNNVNPVDQAVRAIKTADLRANQPREQRE